MTRPPKAPEPDRVPTAYDLATPEQRAFADAVVRALIQDLGAFLTEKRRAAGL